MTTIITYTRVQTSQIHHNLSTCITRLNGYLLSCKAEKNTWSYPCTVKSFNKVYMRLLHCGCCSYCRKPYGYSIETFADLLPVIYHNTMHWI